MNDALAILLAGGAGERLFPLTRDTAKPAVPFGGAYRIIDFTLSNCTNSGLRRIFVLTQYKALDLIRHIRDGWNIFSPELGEFVEILQPMKRVSEEWYLGTADAVFQNFQSIEIERPELTLILAGDHIYKMNYQELVSWHRKQRAEITIGVIEAPPEDAPRYGVLEIESDCRVVGFEEKPVHGAPKRSPFEPSMISASMGIYVFNTDVLLSALRDDARDPDSTHDFGHDVIPREFGRRRVVAFDFRDKDSGGSNYWRDVGTLDAFYEANMDLVDVTPVFNLYDQRWPIRTKSTQQPPAKFVFAQEGRRMGVAVDSVVSAGCIVSGGRVLHSVLSPGVRVNSYSEVEYSILLPGVEIGRHSRIRRAIINTGVKLPESSLVGFDPAADRAKGYNVTEAGITVVG